MKRLVIFFFLLLPVNLFAPATETINIMAGTVLFDKNILTWYSIDYWITEFGIQQPEVVKQQIKLETGNLTSRLCLQCNNLCGMKYARKQQATAISRESNGAAVYKDFIDSIRDYKAWQECFYKGGDYYSFLKLYGYATDRKYIEKLKKL